MPAEDSYMAGMEIQGGQSNQVQTKKENNLCSDINDDISGAKQCIFHYAKLYNYAVLLIPHQLLLLFCVTKQKPICLL